MALLHAPKRPADGHGGRLPQSVRRADQLLRRASAQLLALTLAFPAWAKPVDADTLAMVEAFLKTPTEKLPAESVERFVSVDPKDLPKNLRAKFEAKRLELHSLKQLAAGKKEGLFRTVTEDCEIPREAKGSDIRLLTWAGYMEITEDERLWVSDKTKCTERDMLCKFTLQILDEKTKKGPRRRYFLFCKTACDPLMVLIAAHRANAEGKNTNFFGSSGPTCLH